MDLLVTFLNGPDHRHDLLDLVPYVADVGRPNNREIAQYPFLGRAISGNAGKGAPVHPLRYFGM